MKIVGEEKEWSLTIEGASGNAPTETIVHVGTNTDGNNGLRLIDAVFKPKIVTSKGNVTWLV